MKKITIGILTMALCFLVVYCNIPSPQSVIHAATKIDNTSISNTKKAIATATKITKKIFSFGMRIDDKIIDTLRIKRNQSFSDILIPLGITHQEVAKLVKTSKPVFNTRKINAGKPLLVIHERCSTQKPMALVYRPNPLEYVVFKVKDSLSVQKSKVLVDTLRQTTSGIISQSLSTSLSNPILTNKMVDVFAWQVDFSHLAKGDQYKIVYDEYQANGKAVGYGNIKSAWFKHNNREYSAFLYTQNGKAEYYDKKGQSLRKAFLKYPIKFTRISSRFTRSRFHPVQKRWKAHKGTDFAAPYGTPIRSVGDGVVTKATRSRGNGNYVKIKHNNTYSTQYLHMTRRARGLRRGHHVRKGQIIGYVGSTGLATGPHLCFRFWKNGRQVDALKENIPSEKPIKKKNLKAYKDAIKDQIKQLDSIPVKQKHLVS